VPTLEGNTYTQYADGTLGQYGHNAQAGPPQLPVTEATVRDVFADATGELHIV
jgi:hypothetical protein